MKAEKNPCCRIKLFLLLVVFSLQVFVGKVRQLKYWFLSNWVWLIEIVSMSGIWVLLQSGSLKERGCQLQVFPAVFTGALLVCRLRRPWSQQPALQLHCPAGRKQRPRVVVWPWPNARHSQKPFTHPLLLSPGQRRRKKTLMKGSWVEMGTGRKYFKGKTSWNLKV